MAFSERSLDDYVDVAQRIADFRALYPSGSLQPADPAEPFRLVQAQGTEKNGDVTQQTFVVVVAAAYRTPDDDRPGIGMAWEVFPGRTPYTRGSELMNAETSAWGRAIVAVLASDSKRGVASRQEVEARRAEREDEHQRAPVCDICGHRHYGAGPMQCGQPRNADGSLSRSRTTDEQKAAAGVMTSAQQAEHTALRAGADGRTPAAERAKVQRYGMSQLEDGTWVHDARVPPEPVDNPPVDTWTDQPAGTLPTPPEDKPGSIGPGQSKRMHAAFRALRIVDRAERLKITEQVTGRQVQTSAQLSMIEADALIRHLEDQAKEAAK
jgi:hypothetical protein